MDVSYRTTLELDKIIARAVQLCTCAETKEMMRAIEPFEIGRASCRERV